MKKNLTEIIFLLDRSGSMSGLEKDTIGGFNSFLKNQCNDDGETKLTTVLFDAAKEAQELGIAKENSYQFEASEEGVKEMYCQANYMIMKKRN